MRYLQLVAIEQAILLARACMTCIIISRAEGRPAAVVTQILTKL